MNKILMRHLAERVRDASVAAAKKGYTEAAGSGLCHEGAMEAAIGAIEMLDLDALLNDDEEE